MEFCKKRKLKKLKEFLADININWSAEYLESKRDEINAIEWLIAYYENKTACTPKERLKTMLKLQNFSKDLNMSDYRQTKVLYFWIYYGIISEF